MGNLFNKTPQRQTVTQKQQLPGWVEDAAKGGFKDVRNLVNQGSFNNPFDDPNNPNAPGVLGGPWMGSGVGPQSSDTLAAYNAVRNAVGQGQGTLTNAINTAYGAANKAIPQVGGNYVYSPGNVSGGSFLQGDIGAYMSPYIQNVENAALENMDRSRRQALNTTADAAISKGAFGGSRHGVAEGVTNAETARAMGEMSANLRNQGFTQGAGLMQQDLARALQAGIQNQNMGYQVGAANAQLGQQAQTANQQAQIDQNKTGVQAGTVLGALGGQQQNQALQGATALQASGQAQDAYQQALMADRARLYELFRQAAFEGPNIQQQFLSGTPYGSTTSTTGPAQTQGYNWLLGGLGGAGTGATIGTSLMNAGVLGSGGTAGLAGLGALAGLFSDRKSKTDIEPLGKDPQSGMKMYAYRYKNDPKTYPKVVGPMAQDLEKARPGSTRKIGGKRVVNLGFPG